MKDRSEEYEALLADLDAVYRSPIPITFIDHRGRNSLDAPWRDLHPDELSPLQRMRLAEAKREAKEELARRPRPPDVVVGVDVARFGEGFTSICVRNGPDTVLLASRRNEDTMQTAARVAEVIRSHKPKRVHVDEIGVGAGVVDRLRELGHKNVLGVNVARKPRKPDRFMNLRAEIFSNLRGLLEEKAITLPRDRELADQLSSIRFEMNSSGHIQLESKDSLARRGVNSTDKADAVALAFMDYRPFRKRTFWL